VSPGSRNGSADVLEGAGYDVMYLGPDVPLAPLLQTCGKDTPAVLGLTVSLTVNVPTLFWEVEEVGKLDDPPAAMVGGRALAAAGEEGLSAPVVADAEQVVAVVKRLIATPPDVPYVAPSLAARIPPRGPVTPMSAEPSDSSPARFQVPPSSPRTSYAMSLVGAIRWSDCRTETSSLACGIAAPATTDCSR